MWRFILLTFGFLGWSFYELSGGSAYQPLEGSRQHVAALKKAQAEAAKARVAKLDAAHEARQTALVWPSDDSLPENALGFAVLGGGSGTDDAAGDAVVTRAAVNLDSLPRITITRSQPATSPKGDIQRVTLTSAGADPVLAPETASIAPAVVQSEDPVLDIRTVQGRKVNMRMGPGTKYNVVGKLTGGTEVEVLQEPGNGWVKLRVVETRRVGWMADYLVTAAVTASR